MTFKQCQFPGCEKHLGKSDYQLWQQFDDRSISWPREKGYCRAHVVDTVRKAQIKKEEEGSKKNKENIRPNKMPEFECQDGEVKIGTIGRVFGVGVGSINSLADLGLLSVRTGDHHARKAVTLESAVAFVNRLEAGEINTSDGIPSIILGIITPRITEIKAELEELCQNGANE